MEHILSKAERKELEEALSVAAPHTENEICTLDGEEDFDRIRATIAKKLLEMADVNKTTQG